MAPPLDIGLWKVRGSLSLSSGGVTGLSSLELYGNKRMPWNNVLTITQKHICSYWDRKDQLSGVLTSSSDFGVVGRGTV